MSYRVSIRAAGGFRRSFRFADLWQDAVAWDALRRSRLALMRLDEVHLRDIGITRAMARDEARKSLLTGD